MEKHYVFIKNNHIENILVFSDKNDELAQHICDEQGYDSFIWLGDTKPPVRWSTYNSDTNTFTDPTPQYLYSIGVLSVDPDAPVEETLAE